MAGKYRIFEDALRVRAPINRENLKLNELECDLFKMDQNYSLAHCVASDMRMGAGIAVQFRSQFGRVAELLDQKQLPGGLAILQDDSRYIYYLVTKLMSHGKPTLETLFNSLQKIKEHVEK